MPRLSQELISELLKVEGRIRTIHLIVRRESDFIVEDHWGKEEKQEFYYGTEDRVHEYLKLAPAVLIGASETIKDVVGEPRRVTVTYDKVIVTYIPLGDAEKIVALSLPHEAYQSIPKLAQKIQEISG